MAIGITLMDSNMGLGISPSQKWASGAPVGWNGTAFPSAIGLPPANDNFQLADGTRRQARLLQATTSGAAGSQPVAGWIAQVAYSTNDWLWCYSSSAAVSDSDAPIGSSGPGAGFLSDVEFGTSAATNSTTIIAPNGTPTGITIPAGVRIEVVFAQVLPRTQTPVGQTVDITFAGKTQTLKFAQSVKLYSPNVELLTAYPKGLLESAMVSIFASDY